MICLAVFETNPLRKATLKEWLVQYTVWHNCEIELLWFVDDDPVTKLKKHASRIQIAMIGLDADKGGEIGQVLYRENQDCRILYYQTSKVDLEHLLHTRPISFYLWENNKEIFGEKLDAVYQEVVFSQSNFRYETKSRMYLLPKRNILYFQSELRYVNICLIHGENPRILAKLSEVEKLAGEFFIRIHKSYLVNSKYILWLDKKNRMVLLSNGEQLPVSDAQYERTCEKICSIK